MALTLTFTDNADGSGGVAVVTGSGGGTVSVFAQQVANLGIAAVFAGTRTGDGTLALALAAPATYFIYAISGGVVSNVLPYAPVTRSPLAVHERVILAIKSKIQSLTLAAGPGGWPSAILPAQVFDFMIPPQMDGLLSYPCVLLTIESETETQPGTLTGLDDIGLPVRVWIIDRGDVNQTASRQTYLLWRQQIFRAFRNQRLNEPEIINVEVTTLPILDPKAGEYQFIVLGLMLRAISREPRG